MGEVILVLKILPESPEALESLKAELQKLKPERLEEEPIGFGLSALKFTKVIPDAGGEQEKMENAVRAVKGVGDVEVVMASRAL